LRLQTRHLLFYRRVAHKPLPGCSYLSVSQTDLHVRLQFPDRPQELGQVARTLEPPHQRRQSFDEHLRQEPLPTSFHHLPPYCLTALLLSTAFTQEKQTGRRPLRRPHSRENACLCPSGEGKAGRTQYAPEPGHEAGRHWRGL